MSELIESDSNTEIINPTLSEIQDEIINLDDSSVSHSQAPSEFNVSLPSSDENVFIKQLSENSDNSIIELKITPNLARTKIDSNPESENLEIKVSDVIPEEFCKIFHFEKFNKMQSQVLNEIYNGDSNLVVSSPTASGKTVLFELAIIRYIMTVLQMTKQLDVEQGKLIKKLPPKVVYLAPLKALCSQKLNEWKKTFKEKLGLRVFLYTGEKELTVWTKKQLYHAHIILTTPEKLDVVTRKWRTNIELIRSLSLILIDEIHILGHELRGPVLEVLLARLKSFQTKSEFSSSLDTVRIFGISATIPNLKEVCSWIGCERIYEFGEEYRPVVLEKHVRGYQYYTHTQLNPEVNKVLEEFGRDTSTLVFCTSRVSTAQTAYSILNYHTTNPLFTITPSSRKILTKATTKLKLKSLGPLIEQGLAYHNAGLEKEDKDLIENLFLNQHIKIICTTSTLAIGVNLPCRLVIVKSTDMYRVGEYPAMDVMQMIGRAGRPQFDTKGIAVIMTKKERVEYYENIADHMKPIQSNLYRQIEDHINAEICVGTVKDYETCIGWMKSTFMYQTTGEETLHRIQLNSSKGRQINTYTKDQCMDDLDEKCIELLQKYQCITLDMLDSYIPTTIGKLACNYYIKVQTVGNALNIIQKQDLLDKMNPQELILQILGYAKENERVFFRSEERQDYIRYRNQMRYQQEFYTNDKVECVYYFIQKMFDNKLTMTTQLVDLAKQCKRVINCLKQVLIEKEMYTLVKECVVFSKCLDHQIWQDSQYITKQFNQVGQNISTKLAQMGLTTLEKVASITEKQYYKKLAQINAQVYKTAGIEPDDPVPEEIQQQQINIKFETRVVKIQDAIKHFPYMSVQAKRCEISDEGSHKVRIDVHCDVPINDQTKDYMANYELLVSSGGKLLYQEMLRMRELKDMYGWVKLMDVEDQYFPIRVEVVSMKYFGFDDAVEVDL